MKKNSSKPKIINDPKLQEIITRENKKVLLNLISQLEEDGNSYEFLTPVDYKSLCLPEYPKIIKNPMDISTVKKKLKNGHYKKVSDAIADIQLIWSNCKVFNLDSSDIYRSADYMEEMTNKLVIKKLLNKKERKARSKVAGKVVDNTENVPVPNVPSSEDYEMDSKKEKTEDEDDIGSTMDVDKVVLPITTTTTRMTGPEISRKIGQMNKEGIALVVKILQHCGSKALKDINSENFMIEVELIEEEVLNRIKGVFEMKEYNQLI